MKAGKLGKGNEQAVPIRIKNYEAPWVAKLRKWTTLDVSKIFDRKRGPAFARTVLFNTPLPRSAYAPTKKGLKQLKDGADPEEIDRHVGSRMAFGWEFPSNQVKTSKYTIFTFLPRNLLEQFRRVANIFFLVLVILQFFPEFSQVSPALACMPLLVVLAVSAIKDGYEDFKRHQSDRRTNDQPVRVLQGESIHNPNVTERKEGLFSLAALGLGFLWRDRPSRKERKENRQLEQDEEKAADKGAVSKRHWWGARKRKFKRTSTASRADNPIQGATDDAGRDSHQQEEQQKNPQTIQQEKQQAAPVRAQTEYDEVPSEASFEYGRPKGAAGWKAKSWEDLKVGDFVKLTNNEAVPADIVLCATSEEEDVSYIETKNLDGETNLKSRQAVPELTEIRKAADCTRAKFAVEGDAPSVDMFKYSASVHFLDGRQDPTGKDLRVPVTLNNMLLRGTVLRNTEWAVGFVLASGPDTKIVLNSGGTPSKRSKVERQMNPQVFVNLFLLALMCIMCAVGDAILEQRYYRQDAYWNVFADRGDDNPNINGLKSFANAMITFQNIVPISLYISIEFVKLAQAFFIWVDDEIRSPINGRRTMARSWNLSDDLGQVEYIFSDKTGTLTQNVMQFRQCCIGGKIYKGDDKVPEHTIIEEEPESSDSSRGNSSSEGTRIGQQSPKDGGFTEADEAAHEDSGGAPQTRLPQEVSAPFHDSAIDEDLANRETSQAQVIYGFFMNLALCHTVLAAEEEDGSIQYKAQSPDEAALVQAAADVGFIFRGRDKNELRVSVPGEPEPLVWELLNVIEFTSTRKRMTVFVRRTDLPDAPIYLLMKGADNVVFERSANGQDALKGEIEKSLDAFAGEGLRTLNLAYREIDEETYRKWEQSYADASVLIDGREEAMDHASDLIERDVLLLGSTAIEDKLQEGVPETLRSLKRAGIKVWVCTGDKLETAIAIGMSSSLLNENTNLIIVRGGALDSGNSAYAQLRAALVRFFDGAALADAVDDMHSNDNANDQEMQERGQRPDLPRYSTAFSGVSDLVGDDNGNKTGGYGLVIEGTSLKHAFAEPQTRDMLLELSTRCNVVICCRTSPLQKAQVVRLVRDNLGSMCLAIGDGANDVSMIQAADVGIGVAGEEGLQAVNSSDYAIAQFSFLKRLLLVHGHWDYMRNGNMIVNFFYKNVIGIGVLFFFQFYCAFSTTTVYEYTYLLFWNVLWTLIPVLAIGIFDQAISQSVLMQVPELYRYGREGHWFGLVRFSWYMIDGVYQSAVVFFFILYAYQNTTARTDGYNPSMYEYSTLMAMSAVWAANLYNGMNTSAWNWWVLGSVLFGMVLIVLYTLIYSAISPGWIWTLVYGNNHYLWRACYFWFGWVFTLIVALAPRYIVRYIKENYWTTDIDILKIVGKLDPDHDYYSDPLIPGGLQEEQLLARERGQTAPTSPILNRTRTDMSGRNISTRGFAFDQADGMGETAVGRPLRTWTSRSSAAAGRMPPTTRPRSNSVKRIVQRLGFPVNRTNPPPSGSRRTRKSSIFNRRRSNTRGSETVSEEPPTNEDGTLAEQSYSGELPNRPEIPDPTQAS